MNKLRENFLQENKGKEITIIFANGFQLSGSLEQYDEQVMSIKTKAYGNRGPVLVPYNAVTTYVPSFGK